MKTTGRILIVDDDPDVLTTAKMFLKQHFTIVKTEQQPHNLPKLLASDHYEVVLLDMNFQPGENDGKEGLHWLDRILEQTPNTVVILITAYGEVSLAVEAMKHGATDFIVKPWKNEKLLATIHSALELSRSKGEVEKLKNTQKRISETSSKGYSDFIGESKAIQNVFELLDKVADTDANVLILGENGTGKELVARALHTNSSRKDQVFISVDLGAISETLFESELFGHVKGAFTDAREDRAGSFEVASGGTIFLDEIGNLSLPLQAKLLTVLQKKEVKRVGSNKVTPLDIRLVCATNMPLYEMVQKETFRQDLLYRINTVEIRVPSLKERPEDIPLLVNHFAGIYAKKYRKPQPIISKSVMARLQKYPWPGNVRELQHAVERAVILHGEGSITSANIFLHNAQQTIPIHQQTPEKITLEEMEKKHIMEMLEKNQGNVTQTAKDLGLTRTALYRRLNRHGL